VFLADADPALDSIAHLDRRRHIEPYLISLVDAVSAKNDELITVADRSRRVLALTTFLTDITEWSWPDAPPRKLVFRDEIPKLPQVLPRYLSGADGVVMTHGPAAERKHCALDWRVLDPLEVQFTVVAAALVLLHHEHRRTT
jgi:hypothetical protein